ncbi:HupE/UreJ family protein [Aquirhabdus parva]|uniref:Urease accessory protein n=1 Tax=Aquirhabdus parva TaxID=2283318 RepID=A0A345P849_9GAMM|nr:HupE/UreJ family protein [Aquirhabdus parva]AXI03458.1 urease accessory protein [Aquirhabdus parva]
MRISRLAVLFTTLLASSFALAHPGHAGHQAAFVEGLLHPLTGLDHLAMGLGFGLLMARTFKRARVAGLVLLMGALVAGFSLGVVGLIGADWAEYGIGASLLVLAVALWMRSHSAFLGMVATLGLFHGVAHGAEVPAGLNPAVFLAGMLVTLSGLYGVGLLLGRTLQHYASRYVKGSERLAAVLAGSAIFFG